MKSVMSEILKVDQLIVRFKTPEGYCQAVEDITFGLGEGEFLGIVGESGSGKSVTALSIMRLLPEGPGVNITGRIMLSDITHSSNILSLTPKELQQIRGKRISMIFQEPMSSLNPVISCGKQVSEMLIRHDGMNQQEAREKTLELFDEVLLPRPRELFSAYPHQLSGGQKQRVMIAMAIACDPRILIADEPTTALDVTIQQSVMKLLKSLQKSRGMAVLFITHDLGLVYGYAENVLVMYQGKIQESGRVSEIFSHPRHPYTRGLLACRPVLNRKPYRLPTVQEFLGGGIDAERHRDISAAAVKPLDEEVLIQISGLAKSFRTGSTFLGKARKPLDALKPVTFNVVKGQTLGIVGESGSGKTTLARTLLELIPPSSGKIYFRGKDITRLGKNNLRKLRKELQIIFQDPFASLNPRLTVGSAILEPMRFHSLHGHEKGRREKAEYLMKKVGLEGSHLDRYPHEFSGGQRQRICIARALAVEPDLIICDEAVSALDVSIQAQILNLLNDLKDEFALTYIFISHDLLVVKYMSDKLIVMNNGEIAEMGDSRVIFSNPSSDYTRSLLGAIPGVNT